MKQISISDEFLNHIICVLLTELKKIPVIQSNVYLMILISILESIFCQKNAS